MDLGYIVLVADVGMKIFWEKFCSKTNPSAVCWLLTCVTPLLAGGAMPELGGGMNSFWEGNDLGAADSCP